MKKKCLFYFVFVLSVCFASAQMVSDYFLVSWFGYTDNSEISEIRIEKVAVLDEKGKVVYCLEGDESFWLDDNNRFVYDYTNEYTDWNSSYYRSTMKLQYTGRGEPFPAWYMVYLVPKQIKTKEWYISSCIFNGSTMVYTTDPSLSRYTFQGLINYLDTLNSSSLGENLIELP